MDDLVTQKATVKKSSGRRWLFRGFVFATLLGSLGWFAPSIIATTSLRQKVPKLLFPTYPGAIELGETSLGWLSPVVVKGMKAEDDQGHPFLEVKEFSTSETLWTLATRSTDLGRMRLIDPIINVSIRSDGSNVEDVLTKFLSGPASSAPSPAIEVEVLNARIELENKAAGRSSTLDKISLRLMSTKGAVDDLDMTIGDIPSPDGNADNAMSKATPVSGKKPEDRDSTDSLRGATSPTDWLALRLSGRPIGEGTVATKGTQYIELRAQGWKLDRLLPALARFEPDASLAGELNADAKASFSPVNDSYDWTWDGDISVANILLSGMSSLQHDKVTLKGIAAGGRVAAQRGRLAMQDARMGTDVGEITATGDLPLASLTPAANLQTAQSILGEEDFQVSGHIDLQRIAALLPRTLRIREGTEITSGTVDIVVKGEEVKGNRTWSGGASISGLTAINRGETIAWKVPFKAAFQAHRSETEIIVDRLACQSDFLQVTGGGTLTDAHFSATGDLSKLEQNIDRFIDTGLEKIAGRLKIDGSIKRESEEKASVVANVTLDDFQWNISKDNLWNEDHLELTATGSVTTDGGTSIKQVDTGSMTLTSGGDTLTARIRKPIPLPIDAADVSAAAKITGNLQSWQRRAQPFVSLSGWQIAGIGNIEAEVVAKPKQIDVERAAVDIQQLQLRGTGLFIQEPQFKFTTNGVWKTNESQWTSPQTTITSTAISFRVDNLLAGLTKEGGLGKLSGATAFRADLDKLSRWMNQALELPSYHAMGMVQGRATAMQDGPNITTDFETITDKLVIAAMQTLPGKAPEWQAMWREPAPLKLAGKIQYDSENDNLQLDSVSLNSDGMTVAAKGTLGKVSTEQNADFTGQLGYDWEILVKRFGEYFGKDIRLTGKDQRPFSLKGSLASLSATSDSNVDSNVAPKGRTPTTVISFGNEKESNPNATAGNVSSFGYLMGLTGQGGFGWQTADVYGLKAGPGDVSAQLQKGICQFATLNTTVNDGQVHITPTVRLDTDPATLILPQEKVIDQIGLSPELCGSWLRFVMPMLADAAQVEGKFSLSIGGATLPLFDPAKGEMSGAVDIHKAQVRPGPTALQLVNIIEQARAIIRQKQGSDPNRERVWMQMPEQTVDFQLAQGRMHHRGLTLQIKDVTLRTSGSVGMDETLNLIAELSIPDEWIEGKKILANLKGKSLRIPIGGTLSAPRPDSRILSELTRQIGGTAIEGLFEEKVDGLLKKKLNKFLPNP